MSLSKLAHWPRLSAHHHHQDTKILSHTTGQRLPAHKSPTTLDLVSAVFLLNNNRASPPQTHRYTLGHHPPHSGPQALPHTHRIMAAHTSQRVCGGRVPSSVAAQRFSGGVSAWQSRACSTGLGAKVLLAPGSSQHQDAAQQQHRSDVRCHAAVRKQLPIFPLNVVALPHAVVPLMIFEAR